MKDNDKLTHNKAVSFSQTIYKPEDQLSQKLYLSEYLRELPEIAKDKSENSTLLTKG
jgi:hypothetical protein